MKQLHLLALALAAALALGSGVIAYIGDEPESTEPDVATTATTEPSLAADWTHSTSEIPPTCERTEDQVHVGDNHDNAGYLRSAALW